MNDLEKYFFTRRVDDIHKWSNYFELYERYFARFRNRPIRFLEIGVDRGGSLQMWQTYFCKNSIIVGLDIDSNCKKFENVSENRYVEIGDQSNPEILQNLIKKYGYFDIILDDGSHLSHHQIASFKQLWQYIAPNGVYVVEDIQTSYYLNYDSYIGDKNSFIEYSKLTVDEINSYHRPEREGRGSKIPDLYGTYFHSGMVVFEKRSMPIPISGRSGADSEKIDAVNEAAKDQIAYIKKVPLRDVLSWGIRLLINYLRCDKKKIDYLRKRLKIWYIIRKKSSYKDDYNE